MKKETIIKVLNRYCKSLDVMRKEAYADNEPIDAKQYEFDLQALSQARDIILKILENGKE